MYSTMSIFISSQQEERSMLLVYILNGIPENCIRRIAWAKKNHLSNLHYIILIKNQKNIFNWI